MTRHAAAVLSLRLLALFVWYEAMQSVLTLVYFLRGAYERQPDAPQALGLLLGVALLVLFGAVLHVLAPAIARRIFPGEEPLDGASRPEIGTLALKICGLLLLANFLRECGRLPVLLGGAPDEYTRASHDAGLLLLALRGVVAAAVLGGAGWIARRLYGAPSSALDANHLARMQSIAFSVVGLYLAGIAFWPALTHFVHWWYLPGEWIDPRFWPEVAVIVLGLLLFAGGGSVARAWKWLHTAGLAPRELAK